MPSSGTASLVHLPYLNKKKGLVVLLPALSMTISNIIFFVEGGGEFGKSVVEGCGSLV